MTLLRTPVPLRAGGCGAAIESPADDITKEYCKWRDLTLYVAAHKAEVKMQYLLLVAAVHAAAVVILCLAEVFSAYTAWVFSSGALFAAVAQALQAYDELQAAIRAGCLHFKKTRQEISADAAALIKMKVQ